MDEFYQIMLSLTAVNNNMPLQRNVWFSRRMHAGGVKISFKTWWSGHRIQYQKHNWPQTVLCHRTQKWIRSYGFPRARENAITSLITSNRLPKGGEIKYEIAFKDPLLFYDNVMNNTSCSTRLVRKKKETTCRWGIRMTWHKERLPSSWKQSTLSSRI